MNWCLHCTTAIIVTVQTAELDVFIRFCYLRIGNSALGRKLVLCCRENNVRKLKTGKNLRGSLWWNLLN